MAINEDKIERAVERKMDILDDRLMNGQLTQQQYDREVRELNRWARKQYKNAE